jgi:hypothetical protein
MRPTSSAIMPPSSTTAIPKKQHGFLFWAAICIGFLFLVFIGAAIIGAGTSSSPATAKDSIKVSDGTWTVRTNMFAATRTYTVTGTFTNQGSQTYTFYGGLTLYDSDYNKLNYEGETMTLAPGQSQTITEIFTTDISSADPKGIAYKVT